MAAVAQLYGPEYQDLARSDGDYNNGDNYEVLATTDEVANPRLHKCVSLFKEQEVIEEHAKDKHG